MKTKFLIIGILIGTVLGFAATKFGQNSAKLESVAQTSNEEWKWPENLDAIKAALDNHKIV